MYVKTYFEKICIEEQTLFRQWVRYVKKFFIIFQYIHCYSQSKLSLIVCLLPRPHPNFYL